MRAAGEAGARVMVARVSVVVARVSVVVSRARYRRNLIRRQIGSVDEIVVVGGDGGKILRVSMTADRPLPYVDPARHRGPIYRAWVWFVPTRAGMWLSRNVVWKLDPWLLRLTRGRFGMGLLLRTALLETRGARSGRTRRTAVVYFNDGERVTIIASKMGAPEHPGWYFNLVAHPDVVFGGRPFRAEVIDDEDSRARLWTLADRVLPAFAVYRSRAASVGRTIPIVQLVPN